MPLAQRLAQVTGDRQTRGGAALAPKGLEGLLALAVPRNGRPWSAPYRERAQIAHSTYGRGQPLVGPGRIHAELARLGFTLSARTVAKYMRRAHVRGPRCLGRPRVDS
jgi:hypothetical protein